MPSASCRKARLCRQKRDTPKKDKEKAGSTDISALEDAVALLGALKESVDPNDCAAIEKRLATMQQDVKKSNPGFAHKGFGSRGAAARRTGCESQGSAHVFEEVHDVQE